MTQLSKSSVARLRQATRPLHRRCMTRRLRLEPLEDRLAPATITVTSANDDNAVDGTVSLREAMLSINQGANVNADVNAVGAYGTNDTINFNIGNAAQRITVTVIALPTLSKTLTIDGTAPAGKANQTIEVFGGDQSLPRGTNGLTLGQVASGSKVFGLTIDSFSGDGIDLVSASSVALGAADNGTTITNGQGRNSIYKNAGTGIRIWRINDTDPAPTNNSIVASFIGTDANSTPNIGNTTGVRISAGINNTVGPGPVGTAKVSDGLNVISDNLGSGVYITGGDGNTVSGNYIGTDATGSANMGNGGWGVTAASNHTTIGAQVPVAKGAIVTPANVISGNSSGGIRINGDSIKRAFRKPLSPVLGGEGLR